MEKNSASLLQEIKAETGWSEPSIATEIGVSQPTVNRILNGQEDCKGKTVLSIIALHEKTVVNSDHSRRSTDKEPQS